MKGTFQAVYRFGGPARCQWRRVLSTHATEQAALDACADLTRQGLKVLVAPQERWDRLGLPEGWSADVPCALRAGWWVPEACV